MQYESVIGLEVHIQLNTKFKMFTNTPYYYGAKPNTLVNPTVLGLPGALPVINFEAIQKTIKTGLMFNCDISEIFRWDRKNYFYPDLPKGYQISQLNQPICKKGFVEIELNSSSRNIMGIHRSIRLTRIHLEEDVGKLTHYQNYSSIDDNRTGVPLIEIVSEPDLFSSEEAYSYLKSLRLHIIYGNIYDISVCICCR